MDLALRNGEYKERSGNQVQWPTGYPNELRFNRIYFCIYVQ